MAEDATRARVAQLAEKRTILAEISSMTPSA
jgi:hypothetical protein